jgi:hypothetical protein
MRIDTTDDFTDNDFSVTVDKYGSVRVRALSHSTTFLVDRSRGTDSRLVDRLLAVLTEAKAKLTLREEQHQQAAAAGFKADDDCSFDAWFKCAGSDIWLVRAGTDNEAAPFYWSRRNPFVTWACSHPAIPATTLDEALDACLQDIASRTGASR